MTRITGGITPRSSALGSPNEASPAARLPDELVVNVFSRLGPQQWMAAKDVHRQWRSVAHDEAVRPKPTCSRDVRRGIDPTLKQIAVDAVLANVPPPSLEALRAIGRRQGARYVHQWSYHDYRGAQATELTFENQQRSLAHARTRTTISRWLMPATWATLCGVSLLLRNTPVFDDLRLPMALACLAVTGAFAYAITHTRSNLHAAQAATAIREAGIVPRPRGRMLTSIAAPAAQQKWPAFEAAAYDDRPSDVSDASQRRFDVGQAMAAMYEEHLVLLSDVYAQGYEETYRPDPNMIVF